MPGPFARRRRPEQRRPIRAAGRAQTGEKRGRRAADSIRNYYIISEPDVQEVKEGRESPKGELKEIEEGERRGGMWVEGEEASLFNAKAVISTDKNKENGGQIL